MNKIADVVQSELQSYGVTVYRNKPEWLLPQVVADSNEKKPNIHYAIHINAGGGRGSEVFAFGAGGEGEKLAKVIYAELEPLTPTADRGVQFAPQFFELQRLLKLNNKVDRKSAQTGTLFYHKIDSTSYSLLGSNI